VSVWFLELFSLEWWLNCHPSYTSYYENLKQNFKNVLKVKKKILNAALLIAVIMDDLNWIFQMWF
jgi:hypothetical protein